LSLFWGITQPFLPDFGSHARAELYCRDEIVFTVYFTPLRDKKKPEGTSTHRTQGNQCPVLLCPPLSEDLCRNSRTHTTSLPDILYDRELVAYLCECSGAEPWGFSSLLSNVLWPQDPFAFNRS